MLLYWSYSCFAVAFYKVLFVSHPETNWMIYGSRIDERFYQAFHEEKDMAVIDHAYDVPPTLTVYDLLPMPCQKHKDIAKNALV